MRQRSGVGTDTIEPRKRSNRIRCGAGQCDLSHDQQHARIAGSETKVVGAARLGFVKPICLR